jgi:hypothetical protein
VTVFDTMNAMGGAVEREGEAFRIELATELATWLGSILISVIDSHCANATRPSLSVAVTGDLHCSVVSFVSVVGLEAASASGVRRRNDLSIVAFYFIFFGFYCALLSSVDVAGMSVAAGISSIFFRQPPLGLW